MQNVSLHALADHHLEVARSASAGRSSETIFGGHEHTLRQTLVAMRAETTLGEHESPGEATLQVLAGSVRLNAGELAWQGQAGDFIAIPPARHDLHAIEDAVVLLTVGQH